MIILIKNSIIAFLIFCSSCIYAQDTWKIEHIYFIGLKSIFQSDILKKVTFHIGENISKDDVQNSMKSLFHTGKFDNISAFYKNHTIFFNVKERPIITRVIIVDNKIINTNLLNTYLEKYQIKKGEPLNMFAIRWFEKNINDVYHAYGKYKSHIQIFKNISHNNLATLKFVFQENDFSRISSIKIFGNQKISEKKLLKLLESQDQKRIWNIFSKNIYSSKKLKKDIVNLANFYWNHGYFYFNVNSVKVHFSKDKRDVNIKINISEGEKYRVSNFIIQKNVSCCKKLVQEEIQINKNEIYNKEKISTIIYNIQKKLANYGYINAEVKVYPKINNKNKTIVLYFKIDFKMRYIVHKIFFSGNTLTHDTVLRRAIKQKENSWFNNELVLLGKESLEKTRFFTDVKIQANILSDTLNQVDITYTVQEKKTGSVNFGLGYGMQNGFSANFSFSQENLLGSGNSIQSNIIKNQKKQYADFSILYPAFLKDNISLSSHIFYNNKIYDFHNTSYINKNTTGLNGDLGFNINNNNQFHIGLGYTHNSIFHENKKNSLKKHIDKIVHNITINYSWVYDDLKHVYFPVSGKKIDISGKNTFPGSDDTFYKIKLDAEQYIPLNKYKNILFFTHFGIGFGDSLNKKETLPFYEKFYTSGINSIRGFRNNFIGPKIIYKNKNKKACLEEKKGFCRSLETSGGNAIIMSNTELVIPMLFLEKKYTDFVRSSLFLDIGSIWNTSLNSDQKLDVEEENSSIYPKNIYASAGITFRFFSPIGPLIFSYAYPINSQYNDQIEPFQFTMSKNW